jgi:hypothetical protein
MNESFSRLRSFSLGMFVLAVPSLTSSLLLSNELQNVKSDTNAFVNLPNTDASLVAPMGWEVLPSSRGMTLVMQEPKKEVSEKDRDYSKPVFQRNMTVALIQRPSLMSSSRVNEFLSELKSKYTRDSLVKDFQILEHKLVDHREKSDALVVFTSMTIQDIQMMQVHLLASDAKRQYFISYTDLASEFSNNKSAYEAAWNSMFSLKLNSKPDPFYTPYIPYAVGAAVFSLVFFLFSWLKSRRISKQYHDEGDAIYNDDTDLGVSGAKRAFSQSFEDSYNWKNSDENFEEEKNVQWTSGMKSFATSNHL